MIDRVPTNSLSGTIDTGTGSLSVSTDTPDRHNADSNPTRADRTAALARGDEAAFEAFVRSHGPRLLALARRYLDNRADAEDAVQDAFVALQRHIGEFDGRSSVETWMHRIVVNRALDMLRRRRRRAEVPLSSPGSVPLPEREDHAPPVDSLLMTSETYRRVMREVDRLPPLQRVVVRLRDVDGLGLVETAESLGLDPVTVRVRLHRARRTLRARLANVV